MSEQLSFSFMAYSGSGPSPCCNALVYWTSYNTELVKGKRDHFTCSKCEKHLS